MPGKPHGVPMKSLAATTTMRDRGPGAERQQGDTA